LISTRLTPLVIALLTCTPVLAGEFSLELGGFYSQSDTNMEVTNPNTASNFTLNYESDLQLAENEFLPFVELNYHFNERHHLYLDWKQLHRTAETQALSKPFQIEINDTIYEFKAVTMMLVCLLVYTQCLSRQDLKALSASVKPLSY